MQIERNAINEVATLLRQTVSRSEFFLARSESSQVVCLEECRNSDLYVGIFKDRYGFIPIENNPQKYSVTRMEYNEARLHNIPVFIFIYKDDTKRDPELKRFVSELKDFYTGHYRKSFSNTDELKYWALASIGNKLYNDNRNSNTENQNLRKLLFKEETKRYKILLGRDLEYLDFRGIPQLRTIIQTKLKDIFIKPYIASNNNLMPSDSPDLQDEIISPIRRPGVMVIESNQPLYLISLQKRKVTQSDSTLDSFHNSHKNNTLDNEIERNNCLTILGGPGSGKTTLLKNHCINLSFRNDQIPFFIPLRELRLPLQHLDTLSSIVDEYLSRKFDTSKEFFVSCLKSGSCCVTLDGLDEFLDVRVRKTFAKLIDEFVSQNETNHKVVVSSRYSGYYEAMLSRGFDHFSILPFNAEQIVEFVSKWNALVEQREKDDDDDASKQRINKYNSLITEAIFRNEHIVELAKTPLFLNILCLLNRQGISLPVRKIDLYENIIRAMLKTWELNKGLEIQMDAVDLEDILKKLGLWFVSNDFVIASDFDVSNFISQEMLRFGVPVNKLKSDSLKVINSCMERNGLLIESGPNEISFGHNALKDYFASKEIAGNSNVSEIFDKYFKSSLHSSRYVEIIPAVACILRQQHQERSTEFIKCIVDAGTRHENILHLDLRLALDCLIEGSSVNRFVKEQIFDILNKAVLVPNPNPNLSDTLGKLLMTNYKEEVIQILDKLKFTNSDYVLTCLSQPGYSLDDLEQIIRFCVEDVIKKKKGFNFLHMMLFFGIQLQNTNGLVLDILSDNFDKLLEKLPNYLRIIIHPLVTSSSDKAKTMLCKILSRSSYSTKMDCLNTLHKYNRELLIEFSRDPNLEDEMKDFATKIGESDSESTPTLIDKFKKNLESSRKIGFFVVTAMLPYLTKDDLKWLLEFALSHDDKDISREIIRDMSHYFERNPSVINDLEDILNEAYLKYPNDNPLLAILCSYVDKSNIQLQKILLEITKNKDENAMFRRSAFGRLEYLHPESEVLKLEEFLDDPELINNYSQYMIRKKYRLDLVEEKLLKSIHTEPSHKNILEQIVRSSF